MPEVTRRRLLSSAAAGAGGVLATSILPPALARAAAQGPRRGSLRDVKHVVVHMQENRSFDHYFGTLAGVRGFGDPNAQIQHDSYPRRQVGLLPVRPAGPEPPTATCCRGTSTRRPRARRRSRRPRTPGPSSTSRSTSRSATPTTAGNDNVAPGSPRRRRRHQRPVHDELLRAPGHPVPLRAGRDLHAVRRLPLLAARADLAEPHVPDDRDDRPERHRRRPGHLQRRPQPRHRQAVHLDDLPRAPDAGRDQLARLPGGGRLRDQPARVVRRLPERDPRLARCTRTR